MSRRGSLSAAVGGSSDPPSACASGSDREGEDSRAGPNTGSVLGRSDPRPRSRTRDARRSRQETRHCRATSQCGWNRRLGRSCPCSEDPAIAPTWVASGAGIPMPIRWTIRAGGSGARQVRPSSTGPGCSAVRVPTTARATDSGLPAGSAHQQWSLVRSPHHQHGPSRRCASAEPQNMDLSCLRDAERRRNGQDIRAGLPGVPLTSLLK